MSEKRFVCIDVGYGDDWYITDNGKRLSEMEIVDLLNELVKDNEELGISIKLFEDDVATKDKKIDEQQATITELERKLNKYAKIGEEQLKQIIKLQDELNECRARPTLATDERGVVKVEYR